MDLVQQLLYMLQGISTTLLISIFSFLLGLTIGLPLAFIRTYERGFAVFVDAFEKVFRGIPELVLMLLFYRGVGLFLAFPFGDAFFTATFVLGLRSAANQSQIFKGAIRGVGEEQMVAARSLGLSRLQSILRVMIPQVFIFSTPGLGSEYALLVKDSSYAFVIGVPVIMEQADRIRKATYDPVIPYIVAAILYILLTFPLATWLDTWGSRKKKQLGL
ncbi:MAG: amino acid ABC transporter permease [Candidatus Bathyarchaeia archaeon]|nr:ABC transporter permease subunit [Candidatus Bathyarchaeota archaeon A05DMB-4]MDH7595111.1 ABC transporter permease subunit [Candidatus Bathyarchaeota archaeon]